MAWQMVRMTHMYSMIINNMSDVPELLEAQWHLKET
jgi:hypothetical protein